MFRHLNNLSQGILTSSQEEARQPYKREAFLILKTKIPFTELGEKSAPVPVSR